MPLHDYVTLQAQVWTQLTNANVTAITLYNNGPELWIKIQQGTTVPTGTPVAEKAIPIDRRYSGYIVNRTLAELAPGVSSPNRVFAYCAKDTSVLVSHA